MLLETVPLLEVLNATECHVCGTNEAGFETIGSLPNLRVLDLDAAMGFTSSEDKTFVNLLTLYMAFRLSHLKFLFYPIIPNIRYRNLRSKVQLWRYGLMMVGWETGGFDGSRSAFLREQISQPPPGLKMLATGASIAQNLAPEILNIIIENIKSSSPVSDSLPPSWNIDNESSLSTKLINYSCFRVGFTRRSLYDLEACARVCKAWSGAAIEALYKRVDKTVLKSLSVASTSDPNASQPQFQLELTALGQYVRHLHVWTSSNNESDSTIAKSPCHQWILKVFAPNFSTFHFHAKNYDEYKPCQCTDPYHRHEIGLEETYVSNPEGHSAMRRSIFNRVVHAFLKDLFDKDTKDVALNDITIEGPEGSWFVEGTQSKGVVEGNFKVEESRVCVKPMEKIVLNGGDARVWGVGGQTERRDIGNQTDGRPTVEALGRVTGPGVKNVTLRRLSQPLSLDGIKKFLVEIEGSRKIGSEGNMSLGQHSGVGSFVRDAWLSHLDIDILTPSADSGRVVHELFHYAPFINSLVLDRWALTDIHALEDGSQSVLAKIHAVKPKHLRSLVLPSWTFKFHSQSNQQWQQRQPPRLQRRPALVLTDQETCSQQYLQALENALNQRESNYSDSDSDKGSSWSLGGMLSSLSRRVETLAQPGSRDPKSVKLFVGITSGCFSFLRVLGMQNKIIARQEFTMLLDTIPLLEVLDAAYSRIKGADDAGYDIVESLRKLRILDLDSTMGFCDDDEESCSQLALFIAFRLPNIRALVLPEETEPPVSNFAVNGSAGKCFDENGFVRLRGWIRQHCPNAHELLTGGGENAGLVGISRKDLLSLLDEGLKFMQEAHEEDRAVVWKRD
ncbi:hypothetical protein HDU76_013363 [Blyttiomyces sp. JEL0837]|nr:hypothetical protein HDU76_013363 [Blyttiomyces sp. JEL0837]